MRNLNWRDYQRVLLPWPEVDEQRRIASALKLADDAINKSRAELDSDAGTEADINVNVFRTGLIGRNYTKSCKIHRCYTARSRSTGMTANGQELALVEYGTNAPSNDYRGGYPVIAIPQVVAPHLTLTEVPLCRGDRRQRRRVCGSGTDDVLLIRTNGNPEYIGKSTIVSKEVAETHTIFAST